MKPRYVLFAALAATSMMVLARSNPLPPPGWILAGASPTEYTSGIDAHNVDGVTGAKFIAQNSGEGASWATLMQMISAEQYRGKRVRFQARVKTEDVSGWAGLWLRVDNAVNKPVAFYNSQDKPIKGSTGWSMRSVVLDVPIDAGAIAFGVIDNGKGKVWLDAISLEAVGSDVEVSVFPTPSLPKAPTL
ncbi:MAG: transcriptional regulator [Massilia sp.]